MAEISDFIDQVVDQDFASAQPTFAELISNKMSDALEQQKIGLAGKVFNDEDPNEEQLELDLDDDIEIDDEDIEAALEDEDFDELEDEEES